MADIELVGNVLCLDFANTVNARPRGSHDRLASVPGFVEWAAAVGLPATAAGVHGRLPQLRALREAVYRVFSAIARDASPPPADLTVLTEACAEACRAGALRRSGDNFDWVWDDGTDAQVVLWRVAVSAVDLLRRGPLERVGECPSCGWLFLDTTKNGSRRWCSMATCGSRDKSRRYYGRRQADRTPVG